jgi:hypothetical protein
MLDFVLGRRGHGKTTLAYYLARQARRILVFDPRGGIRHAEASEHSDVATNPMQLRKGVNFLLTGDLTELIFTPDEDPKTGFVLFCREAARLMRNVPRGLSTAVLIDEVRQTETADKNFDWMLRCTDINQFRIILTGHRPKDVPADIRAIGNRWMLFRFTLPIDFDVIKDHTSPEVAARVRQLGPREFVLWDDSKDGLEFFGKPGAWFVPLGLPAPTVDDDDDALVGELETAPVDKDLPFDKE